MGAVIWLDWGADVIGQTAFAEVELAGDLNWSTVTVEWNELGDVDDGVWIEVIR